LTTLSQTGELALLAELERRGLIAGVEHDAASLRDGLVATQDALVEGLLDEVEDRTGQPVVLNTSFNLKGEPMVETPANALSTFLRSGIDTLVMGHHVVKKS